MASSKERDAAQSAGVRHGSLRRSRTWVNVLRSITGLVVVVALSGIATVSYALLNVASGLQTVDLKSKDAVGAGDQSIDGEITMLLVGSDTREGQAYDDGETGELNDVNLLLHVSADHQNATVVSFPRDLMLPIPSCPGPDGEPDYYSAMSEQQLNSTLGYGGLPCTVLTIEELTGMDIPYAGIVTFDGVIAISNAVGGVDVCLTAPLEDVENTGLDLPAGMNTLQGDEALQFLRTRHGVGDGGDLGRINNQQVFMSALMRELKSSDTLSDPLKVYGLAKAGVENLTLSSNMASVNFIQAMAGTVKDIDLERMNFVQYPSLDHPYESGRLTPNYELADVLFETIKSGQPFDVTGKGLVAQVEGETDAPPAEEAPAEETPAEAPAAEDSSESSAGDGTAATTPSGPVQLPESITGVKPDKQVCSGGSGY